MAAAIPAAIGLGSSAIGGLFGKGAARKQEKLARDQYDMLKPLLQSQAEGGKYAIETSKPFIQGAGKGIQDLQKFWEPLLKGDRSAIDMFLAPERRAINQGYKSLSNNLATFAPRGGGRLSALANADESRQGKLSDLVFSGRREAAGQSAGLAQLLGGLGTSTLGAGLGAGGTLANLYNSQSNRAMGARSEANAGLGSLGESLGSFLGGLKLFGGKGYGKEN